MRRRDQAVYISHLGVRLALGSVLYGRAYARRRVKAVRDKWLP